MLVSRNQVSRRVMTRSMKFSTQLSKLIVRQLLELVLSFPFFKTGTRCAVFHTSGTSALFQLRLKISRSVFLAISPRCFSISLLTPSGPGAFFGLRFLMAEFSSEIFKVLFKHGLGTFSCFSSCLSFSFMSPIFFGVRGRVLSLL